MERERVRRKERFTTHFRRRTTVFLACEVFSSSPVVVSYDVFIAVVNSFTLGELLKQSIEQKRRIVLQPVQQQLLGTLVSVELQFIDGSTHSICEVSL